ncbi:MAG: hypothetical protein ACREUC_02880 [Steroidobacteraceae bacterium]
MTTIRRACAAMFASLIVTACGSGGESEQPEPPPVEDTVFGDAVGTMDRARGVEDTTLQHKQDLDRAIDEQTTGER